jgi:hypothetical protein
MPVRRGDSMTIKITMPDEANVTTSTMETVLCHVAHAIGQLKLSHPNKNVSTVTVKGVGEIRYEYGM